MQRDHDVWSPYIFRLELERALDAALQRSRAAMRAAARRERRRLSRESAPTPTNDLHRLAASPSIQLDGWYSEFRSAESLAGDQDVVAFLHRYESPAPRRYGMTLAEERRAWLMQRRINYAAMLDQALARHQGRVGLAQISEWPAIKSERQFAWSVKHRWDFVDELARHGVHSPKQALVSKLKASLGRTYQDALAELVRRRKLAEAGKLDRFTHELV